MRNLQQIHYGREPRIADFALRVRPFRGPVRSPGLGAGAAGREFSARDRIFYSRMDSTWIIVGLAGWALALVFVLLLMRMSAQQDRAARHSEKKLDPFSDVTITQVQSPEFTAAYGGGSPKGKSPKPAGRPPRPDSNGSDAPKDSR